MAKKNMWGNIEDYDLIKAPHEIVSEQNEYLAEMTKGLLELKIERKQSNTIFNYDVYINAPTLNLRHRIFRLTHDFKIYPANLYDEQGTNEYKSGDQTELKKTSAHYCRPLKR